MRVVEQDRDDVGVRVAQQQQQLVAAVGAGERLALAQRQRPVGRAQRSLRAELAAQLRGDVDRRRGGEEQPRDGAALALDRGGVDALAAVSYGIVGSAAAWVRRSSASM